MLAATLNPVMVPRTRFERVSSPLQGDARPTQLPGIMVPPPGIEPGQPVRAASLQPALRP